MENRVLSVFFGKDLLPYKDVERTVHYPVGGSTFSGTNNTYEVHFYVDQIGGTADVSWVVVSKLPNGKVGYQPVANVRTDNELGENYLRFNLSAYYSQYKGVVKLALRGYKGTISFVDDDDTGVYEIEGDPLIEVTGTIDLAINYSPLANMGAQILPTDVDMILASLSEYLKVGNGIVVLANPNADVSDFPTGQVFFCTASGYRKFYIKTTGSQSLLSALPTLEFTELKAYQTITQFLQVTSRIELGNDTYYYIMPTTEGIRVKLGDKNFFFNLDGTLTTTNEGELAGKDFVDDSIDEKTFLKNTTIVGNGTTLEGVFNLTYTAEPMLIKHVTTNKWYIVQVIRSGSSGNYRYRCSLVSIDGNERYSIAGRTSSYTIGDLLSTENQPVATQKYADRHIYYTDTDEEEGTFDQNTTSDLCDTLYAPQFLCHKGIVYTYGVYNGQYYYYISSRFWDDLTAECDIIVINSASGAWWHENYDFGSLASTTYINDNFYSSRYIDNNYYKKSQIDSMITGAFHYLGTLSVSQINALDTSNLKVGDVYNVSDSGTITLGSVSVIAGDNVAWTGGAWDKLAGSIDTSVFVQKTSSANKVYGTDDQGAQITYTVDDFYDGNIARRDSDGSITVPLTPVANGEATSKKYVDDSISGVKNDNYIFVNTTTYATLNDFLATTGVVGNMYLYPIDTSDLTQGYYKYIYENSAWVSLGKTTDIDTSNYVTLNGTQSISGIKTFTNGVYVGSHYYIYENALAQTIYFNKGDSISGSDLSILWYSDSTGFVVNNKITPRFNGATDFGTSSSKWKDGYFGGSLSDGTNAFTIAEGMAQFNPTTNGTNVIKWSQMLTFSLSADTVFTFETAKTNCLNEYKAIITNSGASAILLTFTGVTHILCNDDDCIATNSTNSTLSIPVGATVEINVVDNKLCAVNWEA